VILGLSGPRLLPSESAFFRDANPWGFILFARNIETPEQVRKLTSDLQDCVGRSCLIFVDQEGGRVQRLKPPHWPIYPAMSALADLYADDPRKAKRATYLNYRLIADDLRDVGINADCAPVLDLPQENADPIISDRAFGREPDTVVDMAHAAMTGLMVGGVAPVIKHIPGHGRATVDSHKALPYVEVGRQALERTDFLPFMKFNDAPMAMTAHVIYEYSDDQNPVTVSQTALAEIIRQKIGFDGLLMTDDLDMKALSGSLKSKTEQALKAGCDIALQCSGVMTSMVQVAKGAKRLTGESKRRADVALYCADHITPFGREAALDEYHALMPRTRLVA